MLNRDAIAKLSEAELRQLVLLPLFKAMGYEDVFEYHGGSLEQGKDITMFKPDPFEGRVNYAVVVKAGRISGAAEGSGSAGAAVMQVQQAFGRPYLDHKTGEERKVHRVLVVASGEIKKEAINAACSALEATRLDKYVSWISGETLWDLLVTHIPSAAVADLARTTHLLGSWAPGMGVTAAIRDGVVSVALEADHTVPVKARFSFPDDASGRAAYAALQQTLRTGRAVELDGKYVEIEGLPPALASMLLPVGRVGIGPVPSSETVRVALEAETNSGHIARVQGIELRCIRSGSDEAVFSNTHQSLPWTITLELTQTTKSAKVTFGFKSAPAPVNRLLQLLRFERALSEPARVRLVNEDTDLPFLTLILEEPVVRKGQAALLDLMEAASKLQLLSGVPLSVPFRDFSPEEISTMREIRSAISSGSSSRKWSTFTAVLSREGFEDLARQHGSAPPARMAMKEDGYQWQFFDSVVPSGETILDIQGATLTDEELARAKALFEGGSSEVRVTFTSANDGSVTRHFLNWLSAEGKAELASQYPSAFFETETAGRLAKSE